MKHKQTDQFRLLFQMGKITPTTEVWTDDVKENIDEDVTVSNCCGALPRGNGDNDSEDYGICPDCKEHCGYVKESERDNPEKSIRNYLQKFKTK